MNLCSKPRCKSAGAAVLAYDYGDRRAVLHDSTPGEISPHVYALCGPCAESLRPPRGWVLEDRRTRPPLRIEKPERPDFFTRSARRRSARDSEPSENPARQVFFGYSA